MSKGSEERPMNKSISKFVGILGGMGPESTAKLFSKVISKTPASKDQDHIKMLIYNNPHIPDRTKAICYNGVSPLPYLIDSLDLLRSSGVDLIAIPCVTSHYFYEDLKNCCPGIPILNLIEETKKYILLNYPANKKLGLLATTGTIQAKLFDNYLKDHELIILTPDSREQNKVMEVIYGTRGIKAGFKSHISKTVLLKVIDSLIKKGAEIIVAGCTEITILINEKDLCIPFIDVLDILSEAIVERAGIKRR